MGLDLLVIGMSNKLASWPYDAISQLSLVETRRSVSGTSESTTVTAVRARRHRRAKHVRKAPEGFFPLLDDEGTGWRATVVKGGLKSSANDILRGNLAILAPHPIPRMRATREMRCLVEVLMVYAKHIDRVG